MFSVEMLAVSLGQLGEMPQEERFEWREVTVTTRKKNMTTGITETTTTKKKKQFLLPPLGRPTRSLASQFKKFPTLLAQLFTCCMEELLHEDDGPGGDDIATDRSRYRSTEMLGDIFSPLVWPECVVLFLETQGRKWEIKSKKEFAEKEERDEIVDEFKAAPLQQEEVDVDDDEDLGSEDGEVMVSEIVTELTTSNDDSMDVDTLQGEMSQDSSASQSSAGRKKADKRPPLYLGPRPSPLRSGLSKLKVSLAQLETKTCKPATIKINLFVVFANPSPSTQFSFASTRP